MSKFITLPKSLVQARPPTGGEFGNGIISKTYVMGAVVGLEIEITANHRGAFQFK